ncbi:MAG: leucine-rich repeat protein [Bacteroidaceae bacterium]|nr:leucine-rich repeat protein [Bacteroidaceae bacterium]
MTFKIIDESNKTVQVGRGLGEASIARSFSGAITIPKVVEHLGERYSVETIGISAFEFCFNITSLTIPNSIKTIDAKAFYYCQGLASLTIPSSVTSIGSYAFINCSSLTSITIPSSVTGIGNQTFAYCTALTSFVSNVKVPFTISLGNEFSSISSSCVLTVPYGTKDAYIAAGWTEGTFQGGIVEMPNTRETQSIDLTELPTMTYGDASYVLPTQTTEGLTLTWESGNTDVATISDNTLTIAGAGSATITASQEGNDKYKPFSREYTLTVAKAPLTITAQSYTIKVDDALPTMEVTYSGFKNGDSEDVLTPLPVVTTTATSTNTEGTFEINVSGAEALNYEISYVSGTLSIVDAIQFADATTEALCLEAWDSNGDGYLSKTEAATVTSLGMVFNNNTEVTAFDELSYFTGLTSIGSQAFRGCSSLISIQIPGGVTTIGNCAFSGCDGLTSIEIGEGIQSIGDYAFASCGDLLDVYCAAETPPSMGTDVFKGSSVEYVTLHVPKSSGHAYRAAEGWNGFKNVVVLKTGEEILEDIELTESAELYYNESERTCNSITYTRTFNNTNWQALYVPFSLSYNDWKDDFEVARINAFYEYDMDNDGVVDKQVLEVLPVKEGNGDLRPNYPYLIKAKTTGKKTLALTDATLYQTVENSIECSTVETKYTFTGTYQKMNGLKSAGYYFMSGGGLKTTPSDASTLGAFRWYLKAESKGGALLPPSAEIKIRVVGEDDGEATEIGELKGLGLASSDAGEDWYTINGVKLSGKPAQSGLYIHRGKKIYIQ